jgi:uncharacterized protein (TIGR03067 family)
VVTLPTVALKETLKADEGSVLLAPVGEKIPNIVFPEGTLRGLAGKKASVVISLSFECPVCTDYCASLGELARTYGPRGVSFVGITPNDSENVTGRKDRGKEEGTGPKDAMLPKLQGTWVAVSAQANGREFVEKVFKEMKPTLVISGDKFTATAQLGKNGKVTWTGKIEVGSTKRPLTFDLIDGRLEFAKTKGVMKVAGVKGIYELKADTLKVCYGPERPTAFKTKPDSSRRLYVFKRENKEKIIPK